MPGLRIRDLNESDLDQVVRLWEESTASGAAPVFHIGEAVAAVLAGELSLAAVVGDRIVGTVVTRITGDRAWILRVAVIPELRKQGIGGALLDAIDHRLVALGVRRSAALLPADETGEQAFVNRGFERHSGVDYFEKVLVSRPAERQLLDSLGGQVIESGLWARLKGMETEKSLIERRVILPLAEAETAERHGVTPPKAIILFGPPGTGKTTFARGIASRLDWPFVELFPSRLAAGGRDAQANELKDFFAALVEIERLVLFIDEVEEIASSRENTPVTHGVTNELLKAIPLFRGQPHRLLVCATNSVRSLDGAFVRPGRFDYLLPVGPPDESARAAIWGRYVSGITDSNVDIKALVAASSMFTPADIEFAARKGAQAAFERAVLEKSDGRAETGDFLWAISQVRPSLTRSMIREFEEDIEDFARH
ncbi:MAG: GNAT family N-acetyltransferase [Actinobacteria bacterium]|nr:GNAT family N-acetyltransferase [Actinomycetota bacterium]